MCVCARECPSPRVPLSSEVQTMRTCAGKAQPAHRASPRQLQSRRRARAIALRPPHRGLGQGAEWWAAVADARRCRPDRCVRACSGGDGTAGSTHLYDEDGPTSGFTSRLYLLSAADGWATARRLTGVEGAHDTDPVWLDDATVAFMSSRKGALPPSSPLIADRHGVRLMCMHRCAACGAVIVAALAITAHMQCGAPAAGTIACMRCSSSLSAERLPIALVLHVAVQ